MRLTQAACLVSWCYRSVQVSMNLPRFRISFSLRRSRGLQAAALFVAILLSAGCRQQQLAKTGLIPVRMAIGSQTEMVYLPSTLADRLGFYEAEGLRVDISDTAAGAKALETLLGGSADVVTGFYDHTIQMASQGKSVKAFTSLVRLPGAVAVLSPAASGRIHRIEDLRKAVAGVTSPGSSSHFFLNYLLLKHGVPLSDVTTIATGGGASRIVALERNKVDVCVLYEPSATQMLHRNPSVKILADTRTSEGVREVYGTPVYPSAVLYSTGEWLAHNPDAARRLARALRKTLAWIESHSAEQIAEKMPAPFRGDDPAIYLEALRHSKSMFSTDGVMPAEGAEAVLKVLSVSLGKVRNSHIDLAATYTNEFLPAAK